MSDRTFTAVGPAIQLDDGQHIALCRDNQAAELIVECLNNSRLRFSRGGDVNFTTLAEHLA